MTETTLLLILVYIVGVLLLANMASDFYKRGLMAPFILFVALALWWLFLFPFVII